jgi:hypothetical protein
LIFLNENPNTTVHGLSSRNFFALHRAENKPLEKTPLNKQKKHNTYNQELLDFSFFRTIQKQPSCHSIRRGTFNPIMVDLSEKQPNSSSHLESHTHN